MSRTLAAGMVSHLSTSTHTRCGMLRLDLVDGSAIAVTDHDRTLTFDLGDGAADYNPRTGILPSDISLSVGFDADEVEVTGPLVEVASEAWHVTRAMVVGGRFDDATARYFQVNWNSLASGPVRLLRGRVVLAEVSGGTFRLVIQSEISRFAQEVGRTITAYCDADFGDARCGYDPATVEATVIAVASAGQFGVSFSGTFADGFFDRGTARFTAGNLSGTRPIEVFSWTGAGVVSLWTDLAALPEIGDTLELKQGCGKTRVDCLAYDNVINFRGFPDVPGTDQVLRYPNPAS